MEPGKRTLAIVGVGNTIAGDDGAGVVVVRRLKQLWAGEPDIFFHTLEGDPFEIADLLDRAVKFIFVDALAAMRPGELVRMEKTCSVLAPSLHQADIATVMHSLATLGAADPFPSWELWGITILPPSELGDGLTPEVEAAVEILCGKLSRLIEATIGAVTPVSYRL
jgi:hydrogenase maturation protease